MMRYFAGPRSFGVRNTAIAAGLLCAFLSANTYAQIEDSPHAVDPDVFKLFVEAQMQTKLEQVPPQQRNALMQDLMNIYAVTNLPEVKALESRADIQAQLELQRRGTLYNTFASNFFAQNPATDEEIEALYKEQIAFTPPTEYKARHILVETADEASSIIEELEAGADFEELAKKRSTGPSAERGGDLGWFTAAAMVKPFSEAVALLENGAHSIEPVQTQFGWHVILREESREGVAAPLDSVREALKNRIEQERFFAEVDRIRQAAAN